MDFNDHFLQFLQNINPPGYMVEWLLSGFANAIILAFVIKYSLRGGKINGN